MESEAVEIEPKKVESEQEEPEKEEHVEISDEQPDIFEVDLSKPEEDKSSF